MKHSTLTPRAVMLMTKIKRELVINGVDMRVIDGMKWEYRNFEQVCQRVPSVTIDVAFAELSAEIQREPGQETWRI